MFSLSFVCSSSFVSFHNVLVATLLLSYLVFFSGPIPLSLGYFGFFFPALFCCTLFFVATTYLRFRDPRIWHRICSCTVFPSFRVSYIFILVTSRSCFRVFLILYGVTLLFFCFLFNSYPLCLALFPDLLNSLIYSLFFLACLCRLALRFPVLTASLSSSVRARHSSA